MHADFGRRLSRGSYGDRRRHLSGRHQSPAICGGQRGDRERAEYCLELGHDRRSFRLPRHGSPRLGVVHHNRSLRAWYRARWLRLALAQEGAF
jgi:hypothetical protein